MPQFVMTKSRSEAFSDGVFSIVITLMAFDLRLPADTTDIALARTLIAMWPKFLIYGLSFVLVGMYWVTHHQMFHLITHVNRNILWMNLILLMVIAVLPFSAGMIGTHPNAPPAIVFYGVNLFLISIFLRAIWHYACYKRMVSSMVTPAFNRAMWVRGIFVTLISLSAILISLVNPHASLYVYMLLLLIAVIPHRLERLLRTAD